MIGFPELALMTSLDVLIDVLFHSQLVVNLLALMASLDVLIDVLFHSQLVVKLQ